MVFWIPERYLNNFLHTLSRRIYPVITVVYLNPEATCLNFPRILKKRQGLGRPSQINITPGLETKRFEVALPITFFQYKYPGVSASVRVNSITFGSEKIHSIIGRGDFSGFDIYDSLKLNPTILYPVGRIKKFKSKAGLKKNTSMRYSFYSADNYPSFFLEVSTHMKGISWNLY